MKVSEVDPLLKKRAPIELIVNPTIRSATPAGIDLTFTPYKRFTEFKVECVSKLLMLAGCAIPDPPSIMRCIPSSATGMSNNHTDISARTSAKLVAVSGGTSRTFSAAS